MLRTRIILNLFPFVAILIAVGVYAMILFSQLANSVGKTVTDNYQGNAAANNMSEALARMDSALQRSRSEEMGTPRLMFETLRMSPPDSHQTMLPLGKGTREKGKGKLVA